jgi:hypothetical protein
MRMQPTLDMLDDRPRVDGGQASGLVWQRCGLTSHALHGDSNIVSPINTSPRG